MKIYTLIPSEYDCYQKFLWNLGDCGFRLEPRFQDVVEYWVRLGESRKEVKAAIKDCIEEISLDSKSETQYVLSHPALMFTSVPVLSVIESALNSHELPSLADFIIDRENRNVSDFNPKDKPRVYLSMQYV